MEIKNIADLPPVITPEVIDAIVDNADSLKSLKSLLSTEDETAMLRECDSSSCCPPCCCPKFLKFKIIGCTVIIINDNAECQGDGCPVLNSATDEN